MSKGNWLEYVVVPEDDGLTVEQIIRERLAVSGRMLQRLTRSKGIQVNRKVPFLQRLVKAGDRVSVRITDKPAAASVAEEQVLSPSFQPEFLFQDQHFLIVNKAAGVVVHPLKEGQTGTLVQLLSAWLTQHRAAATVHAVHRLDKDTSGAILLARSGYTHQLADRLLREGTIKREYLAVLCGQLEQDQGTITAPIARDPAHATRRRVAPKGEAAITHYEVLGRSDNYTLVRVRLETGRTHQIRVHFQHIGHPLAGDKLYGGETTMIRRQALHASHLAFTHPLAPDEITVIAPLPGDLATFVSKEFGIKP